MLIYRHEEMPVQQHQVQFGMVLNKYIYLYTYIIYMYI